MMQKLILTSVVSILIAGVIPILQKSLNHYLMGFFRDVARVKARNRRMKSDSLISMGDIKSIIFDQEEDPLRDVVQQIMLRDENENQIDINNSELLLLGDSLPVYTREELYEYGNGDKGTILLSIFGRIYDVTSGEKFYGKDGKYHLFAGRDVTRALSTGCLEEKCLGPVTSGTPSDDFRLNEKAVKEGKKWLAFFQTHDSYSHIGFLKDGDNIEDLMDEILRQEIMREQKVDEMES